MTRIRCHGQPHPVAHALIGMCVLCRRRIDADKPGDQWRDSMAKVDPTPISEHDKAGRWACKGLV